MEQDNRRELVQAVIDRLYGKNTLAFEYELRRLIAQSPGPRHVRSGEAAIRQPLNQEAAC
jgi:hypothetical protein